MRYITILIFSLCFCPAESALAQYLALAANDTAGMYYAKTDFSQVDSLDLWSFFVNKDVQDNVEDSLRPVYTVTFTRSKPINNFYVNIENLDKDWQPSITYKVYRLRDSSYCYHKSRQVRASTNFVPPYAGGDYFIIGKFIFLNTDVCLSCIQYRTGRDYCRPVVNALLGRIDVGKPFSIEGIVRQFGIKRVEPEPDPKRKPRRKK